MTADGSQRDMTMEAEAVTANIQGSLIAMRFSNVRSKSEQDTMGHVC